MTLRGVLASQSDCASSVRSGNSRNPTSSPNARSLSDPRTRRLAVFPTAQRCIAPRSALTSSAGTPMALSVSSKASPSRWTRKRPSFAGTTTGSKLRSLTQSATWTLPTRTRLAYQSPRTVSACAGSGSNLAWSLSSSFWVHRRTNTAAGVVWETASIGAGQRYLLAVKRSCRVRTIEWPPMRIALAHSGPCPCNSRRRLAESVSGA